MKVFAIDLDGTLLDENKAISESDAASLVGIQKHGDRIVLATGRNQTEANLYIDILELRQHKGAVILADGQYIEDFCNDKTYELPFLNIKDTIFLLNLVTKDNTIEVITPGKNYYIFYTTLSAAYWKFKIRNLFSKNAAISKKHIKKMNPKRIEKIVTDRIIENSYREEIERNYELFYVHDKKRYEIKQKHVNKAKALSKLIKEWGVSRENLYVFGNDDNDICMMNLTQNSYAVFDSTDIVKETANYMLKEQSSAVVDCILSICK